MIRRLTLSLLFLLALTVGASAVGCAGTGSCFWEGGTGNISDTTKWCTTNTNPCSGTTGSIPTSADNCNFTSVSNATAYTVTVDATANCKDMTWALPGTSGVPTLAGSATLNIFGSLTNIATMLWTKTGTVQFLSSTTGKTITSAGVVYGITGLNFSGVGGGWTLQDDFISSSNFVTVTQGTLVTNGKTLTCNTFTSTSGTRTLTLDNSTINITGTSGSPWSVTSSGTLTITLTGSTINYSGGAAGVATNFSASSAAYNTVNITAAGLVTINAAILNVKTFSYTSTTNKTDQLIVAGGSGVVIAASGSLTLAGNSTVNRAFVLSSTLGTQRTITVPNTATVTLTNTDFQDIASAGTFGTWTGTSLGDALGNSGITFDPSVTLTYLGGTHNWSDGAAAWSGTTNRTPLPQDDVVVNTTTAGTLTADMPRLGRNIDFTSYTRTATFNSLPTSFFGNWTFSTGMTVSTGNFFQITAQGRGANTVTSNGKAFPNSLAIFNPGGSYTLQDGLTLTNALLTGQGVFDSGAFSVSAASFSSQAAPTQIKGTLASIWSFSAASGLFWSANTVVTTNFFATIKYTGNTVATATFAGNGNVYRDFWWSNTAATGTLIITGANTFNDFKVNRTTARGITFPAATTTTIASWTDESLGTAVLTVNSSSATSAATLSKSSGMVSTDYLSIRDSAATGGAAFFAGNHSTNTSNNSGWIFSGPGGGGLLTMGVGGWLLERDLHPANDNHPVGLDRAA